MRLHAIAAALAVASAAHASSVSDEVTSNSTEATASNPRSGNVADNLSASFDVSDNWTLNAGATLTLEGKTPALERGAFGSSGSAISSFSLGVDWQPSDPWTISLDGDWSPQSTQFSGTTVAVDTAGTQADALLRSQSSSEDLGVDVSYDTGGESNLEWSFGGGVSTTHVETNQAITRVRTASGAAATSVQVRDACATSKKCSRALLAALRAQDVTLDSQKLNASATAILAKDTDLTLSGDYYLYDQDPTQVGYYSLARIGRVGNGLNIAPLQFAVRPEVVHRIGGFQARLWVQAGQYVAGAGQSTASLGLKLQYKFTKALRMWASAAGQRDVDEAGNQTKSSTIGAGAAYRF